MSTRIILAAVAAFCLIGGAQAAPLTLIPKHAPTRDFTIADVDAWPCDLRRNPAAIFAGRCDTKPDPMGTLTVDYEPRETVSW